MKSHRFSLLALLFVLGMMGFAGQALGQQHTVQSAAPALQQPASVAPVNPDPETGRQDALKSTTSDAIGGSAPVEANVPATGGTVQTTEAELKRELSPAEIEELEDGK